VPRGASRKTIGIGRVRHHVVAPRRRQIEDVRRRLDGRRVELRELLHVGEDRVERRRHRLFLGGIECEASEESDVADLVAGDLHGGRLYQESAPHARAHYSATFAGSRELIAAHP